MERDKEIKGGDQSDTPQELKQTVRFTTSESIAEALGDMGIMSGVVEIEHMIDVIGGGKTIINRYEAVLLQDRPLVHTLQASDAFGWEVVKCYHIRTQVIQVKQRRWDKMCLDCRATVKDRVDPPGWFSGKMRVIRMGHHADLHDEQ